MLLIPQGPRHANLAVRTYTARWAAVARFLHFSMVQTGTDLSPQLSTP